MRLLPLDTINPPATRDHQAAPQAQVAAANPTNNSAYLLQRTHRVANDDSADPSYWTAYDYFMVERAARSMRRAHLADLIASAWRRLRELPDRFTATKAVGPHR